MTPNVADASRNRLMPLVLGRAGNAGDLLFHASRAKTCLQPTAIQSSVATVPGTLQLCPASKHLL